MKILVCIMLNLWVSSIFAQAEWDENGSDIHNTNSGKVGIGTTTPEYRLTVNGEEGSGPSLLLRNSSFDGTHSAGTASMQFAFANHLGPKIEAFKSTFNTTGLNFYTEYGFSSPQLMMTLRPNGSGGNVGIGTAEPQSKLHISTPNSMVLRFERPSSDVFGFEISGTISGFYNYTTSKWVWRANNGNMLLAETSGNVGIGTNAPDAKLTVKGTIHTEEVKVDLNGVLAPDYVFDESYDLLSLDEVGDYIKTNKHLPDVPSADEMAKNGLNLKEMNLLLLKKVEELTLYVIELKKENEEIRTHLK